MSTDLLPESLRRSISADLEPVRPLVDDMKAAEAAEEVIVVNFIHGFAYGDVPDMGSNMVVVTDVSKYNATAYPARRQRFFLPFHR